MAQKKERERGGKGEKYMEEGRGQGRGKGWKKRKKEGNRKRKGVGQGERKKEKQEERNKDRKRERRKKNLTPSMTLGLGRILKFSLILEPKNIQERGEERKEKQGEEILRHQSVTSMTVTLSYRKDVELFPILEKTLDHGYVTPKLLDLSLWV